MAGMGKDTSSMTMMDLFRQEAENHCVLLSENLAALKKKADDPEALAVLMRSAHSMKGAARIMDIDGIVGLAHAMEKMFVAAQNSIIEINDDAVGLLLQSVGKLCELGRVADEDMQGWMGSQQGDIDLLVDSLDALSSPGPAAEPEHKALEKSGKEAASVPGPDRERSPSLNEHKEKKEYPSDLSSLSMMDLFRLEAETHCATLTDNLLALEKKPSDADALASLMRAAHSIKGAARIIGLNPVVNLAHSMEDVFVAAQDDTILLGNDDVDLLLRGVDRLEELRTQPDESVEEWLAGQKAGIDQLAGEYAAISMSSGKKKSKPVDSPGYPSGLSSLSMMDLFRQEAETHCATLSDNLLALEKNAGDADSLASLMRAAHSIKGAARIIELNNIVGLAHSMEDVFAAAQEGRISLTRDHIDVLLRGIDIFGGIAAQDDSHLESWFTTQEKQIKELEQHYRRMTAEEAPGAIPSQQTEPGQKKEKTKTPAQNKKSVKQPVKKIQKQNSAEQNADRTMKVSAEGMNRLMGFAGEVQVESRWLPSFAQKLLQLKHRQDDVHRLMNIHSDAIGFDAAGEISKNEIRRMISKIDVCRTQLNEIVNEIEDHARRSTEISHHLYQEVLANRMRPFEDGIRGFPRMVRDVARELGKNVTFEIVGADTLVDRDILSKIESPLNHLIRNAIDHGIEMPRDRLKAGKPEQAVIRLEARHSAGMLSVVVSDDGCGIDTEKLRGTIIAKNMITEEAARQLGEAELLEFLFLPNFSTRNRVSKVSGRGVGLDVVHSAVQEVRGIIRTTTELGSGTSFELQLPLTLSVMRSLLVEISDELYAFPLAAIDHVLRLEEEVKEVEGRQYVTFGNERIGLVAASQVIEKERKKQKKDQQEDLLVLVISDHYNRYGLIVDAFIEIRDLVVQPLDRRLKKVQDISSVAILENGAPVLIVDVEDMVRTIDSLISGNRLRRIGTDELQVDRGVKRILVVDDSITVREVERKMLSARGYEVQTAVDGVDGWNTLRSDAFDLVLSDVDMPRMNGIELISLIRQDSRFENLPVIIVSYKDREEDRNRGLEAGADYYLTKGSFQDEALVKAVEELIGSPVKG